MQPQFKSLQARLNEIIQASGHDKTQFAKDLGYTPLDHERSTINRVLAGDPITYSALCDLAFALGRPPILFRDGAAILLGRFAERCAVPVEQHGLLADSVEDYFYAGYLSDVLRDRRNQKGRYVPQDDLNSRLGLPRGIVCNAERGEGRPSTARIELIFGKGLELEIIYLPDTAVLVDAVRQSSTRSISPSSPLRV